MDEKYYLSKKMLDYFTEKTQTMRDAGNGFKFETNKSGVAKTITTRTDPSNHIVVAIPEATKKGYAIAEVGDGIYLDRPEQKRGVVQKGMTPTIKTQDKDIGVVVADNGLVSKS